SDSLSKIYVLSFKKQIKDYKGTLYILEKNKKETPFEMTEIEIDDKIVIFNVPKLNMTFKGEISENLFDLSGEFTINNQTNQYYSAEKTMDEIYYEFRDDFIKKE
ncbi:MAG: hypothetical protein U9Q83_02365, partial [Bacteroidota bacterium]|nr:hypothetical protein [Bacteroidota bacterium]